MHQWFNGQRMNVTICDTYSSLFVIPRYKIGHDKMEKLLKVVLGLNKTMNSQKIFKRVMNYERMRIIHYDSSLYLYNQSLFIKRRPILHTVV